MCFSTAVTDQVLLCFLLAVLQGLLIARALLNGGSWSLEHWSPHNTGHRLDHLMMLVTAEIKKLNLGLGERGDCPLPSLKVSMF